MKSKGIFTKTLFTLLTFISINLALPTIDSTTYCGTKKDQTPDLTLVYSSDINGYYKPCG